MGVVALLLLLAEAWLNPRCLFWLYKDYGKVPAHSGRSPFCLDSQQVANSLNDGWFPYSIWMRRNFCIEGFVMPQGEVATWPEVCFGTILFEGLDHNLPDTDTRQERPDDQPRNTVLNKKSR